MPTRVGELITFDDLAGVPKQLTGTSTMSDGPRQLTGASIASDGLRTHHTGTTNASDPGGSQSDHGGGGVGLGPPLLTGSSHGHAASPHLARSLSMDTGSSALEEEDAVGVRSQLDRLSFYSCNSASVYDYHLGSNAGDIHTSGHLAFHDGTSGSRSHRRR